MRNSLVRRFIEVKTLDVAMVPAGWQVALPCNSATYAEDLAKGVAFLKEHKLDRYLKYFTEGRQDSVALKVALCREVIRRYLLFPMCCSKIKPIPEDGSYSLKHDLERALQRYGVRDYYVYEGVAIIAFFLERYKFVNKEPELYFDIDRKLLKGLREDNRNENLKPLFKVVEVKEPQV